MRLCLWALLLASCGHPPLYQEQAYVFGTLVEISIQGVEEPQAREAAAAVLQEFQRLHQQLHAWQPSELSRLNAAIAQGKSRRVSPELAALLKEAARISEQSGGRFNPAIGGLIALWGFQSEDFKPVLPEPGQIEKWLKAKPRMADLVIGTHEVHSRNPAVRLDSGGFAKGYALDRAAILLKERGIHNALINIGGNVMALGSHGSRPWKVGIQHPRRPGPLAVMELYDGEAIGTSGDYQRYFELNGKRYCHLIDPASGKPVQGVQAVTVLARGRQAGLRSDTHSKPLFIAGVSGWREAARTMQIGEALLVDEEGVVHLTAAMQKRLKFVSEDIRKKLVP